MDEKSFGFKFGLFFVILIAESIIFVGAQNLDEDGVKVLCNTDLTSSLPLPYGDLPNMFLKHPHHLRLTVHEDKKTIKFDFSSSNTDVNGDSPSSNIKNRKTRGVLAILGWVVVGFSLNHRLHDSIPVHRGIGVFILKLTLLQSLYKALFKFIRIKSLSLFPRCKYFKTGIKDGVAWHFTSGYFVLHMT
ncbi:unnamed protein product [Fraxinus pennsylvanica]|uniref:Transmembrane protein n=1 Tax=Fraxinus pennsylvanica TaxID=56036 RepID=A0AAD1ZJ24_9LAMI|nr:unnamed protein product [Fraxinus pennsylvanica]